MQRKLQQTAFSKYTLHQIYHSAIWLLVNGEQSITQYSASQSLTTHYEFDLASIVYPEALIYSWEQESRSGWYVKCKVIHILYVAPDAFKGLKHITRGHLRQTDLFKNWD